MKQFNNNGFISNKNKNFKKHFFQTGKAIDLMGTINISVINALWSIITGEKLEIEDPNLKKIVILVSNFVNTVSLSGSSPLAFVLPRAMTRWPILDSLSGFKLTKDAVDSMVNLISPHIEEHERTLDPTNGGGGKGGNTKKSDFQKKRVIIT